MLAVGTDALRHSLVVALCRLAFREFSAERSRDLRFAPALTQRPPFRKFVHRIVIPIEAKRSGRTCCFFSVHSS
jgi:hypothetical protein